MSIQVFVSGLRACASFMVIALFAIGAGGLHAACPFVASSWDAINDGLVLNRYAQGVVGSALNANTKLASTDPTALKNSLDSARPMIDMNGDGQITTVDSVIVTRYLAGFRGDALTAGLALGTGARNSTSAILTFIDAGCPASTTARTPMYEALPYVTERTALLTQANAQGARGFQLIGGLFVGSQFTNLYVKDGSATFTYEALDAPTTPTALTTQLNTQGARGFRLDSFLTTGVFYVKDNSATLTYQYELPTAVNTSSAFLSQANAQGARGFFFVFTYSVGGSTVAIYGKDSSASTYQFELHPQTDQNVTPDDFVVQANTQGQRGFKYTTGFFFSDTSRNIYVRDSSQSATFSFAALATTSSASALVTQANAQGQLNFALFGELAFFPDGFLGAQQSRNIYFKPTNCAGWVLCSAGGPF